VIRCIRPKALTLIAAGISGGFLWGQVGSSPLPVNEVAVIESKALAVTLEEALDLALEGNTSLQAQGVALESSRRAAQSSWNAFLPGISLSGSLSNSHSFTSGSEAQWNWGASGGLNLSLTAGIPVQMKLTALQYEMAQISYESQVQTIMANVSNSFYKLLTAKKNLEVLEDNLALTKEQYEQSQVNYNRGLASELDMLRSQYAFVSAEPQLERAQSQYEADLVAFQLLIGSEVPVIPTGDFQLQQLNLPAAQDLVDTYLENRLDVIQKKQLLQEAELKKTSQVLSARAPSISLSESIRVSPAGGKMDGEPSISGSFSIGVSIPVDGFIPGSSKSLSIKNTEDAITTARMNLETTMAQASQDIVTKAKEVKLLWNEVEIARLNETIAERAYQLSQEGYGAGLVSQTDLENSRQQMVSAQLAGSTSQSQYLVGVEQLAHALGLTEQEVYELYGIKE